MFEREPGYPPREPGEVERYGPAPLVPENDITSVPPYETSTAVRPPGRVFVQAYDPRAERIVWLIVAVVDVLLAMRFIFMLLGASTQAAFVSLLYGVTLPLVAPFEGMFSVPSRGGAIFEPASLVALVVYTLIGWVIVAIIRIRHSRRRPAP